MISRLCLENRNHNEIRDDIYVFVFQMRIKPFLDIIAETAAQVSSGTLISGFRRQAVNLCGEQSTEKCHTISQTLMQDSLPLFYKCI